MARTKIAGQTGWWPHRARSEMNSGEIKAPGAGGAGHGSESVPGNEGVGEHVRTRFRSGLEGPVKLRISEKIRTERRKPVSSAGPALKERTPSRYDPAV
jgi:hypothetical protein